MISLNGAVISGEGANQLIKYLRAEDAALKTLEYSYFAFLNHDDLLEFSLEDSEIGSLVIEDFTAAIGRLKTLKSVSLSMRIA